MRACGIQFDTAVMGLHKAIFNQQSIDFKWSDWTCIHISVTNYEYLYMQVSWHSKAKPYGLLHKPCFSHSITPLHMPKIVCYSRRLAPDWIWLRVFGKTVIRQLILSLWTFELSWLGNNHKYSHKTIERTYLVSVHLVVWNLIVFILYSQKISSKYFFFN